ncbi:MAG: hypothetical protein ACD_4C00135G0004 [uncultured bacterium (gcode 4)]|uniref:Lipoprotein n=1 Tax=uncultured bacterium (gcode 4) TaxID=1234023 RepID=K2GU38_9BACT|nr:MAG: hypothetical protein ACD_4C00135G0004 [uncultured bacterium (gcode 4)]
MKKIFFLSLFAFLLVSCGSSSTESDNNVKKHTGSGFVIDIPSSWTVVDNSQIPNIKSWKIELAVSSSDISSGFANNLVIIWEQLNEKITSKKYSTINYALTNWNYLEFSKLDEKTISFSDKDESNLYIFEAKYNTSTPKRKFLQTSKVCDNKVHLITIWISLDITDASKYENLIKSFECK